MSTQSLEEKMYCGATGIAEHMHVYYVLCVYRTYLLLYGTVMWYKTNIGEAARSGLINNTSNYLWSRILVSKFYIWS